MAPAGGHDGRRVDVRLRPGGSTDGGCEDSGRRRGAAAAVRVCVRPGGESDLGADRRRGHEGRVRLVEPTRVAGRGRAAGVQGAARRAGSGDNQRAAGDGEREQHVSGHGGGRGRDDDGDDRSGRSERERGDSGVRGGSGEHREDVYIRREWEPHLGRLPHLRVGCPLSSRL